MKSLLLPVCCAAVAASAADLKDASVIAREWKTTVEEAREPIVADTLDGQTRVAAPKPLKVQPFLFAPDTPAAQPPTLRGPFYDAPGYRRPRQLPHDRPPGSQPWQYNGQTYWLVPLAPGTDR